MNTDKAHLRQQAKRRRAMISAQERADKSAAICEAVSAMEEWRAHTSIALYYPYGGEADITPLATEGRRRNKTIYLPTVTGPNTMLMAEWRSGDTLQPGAFGIMEPPQDGARTLFPAAGNLLMVPLVGFDLRCNRLGWGGGYYDRFLAAMGPGNIFIGVGFDAQEVHEIVADDTDIALHAVVTESRIIRRR